MASQNSTATLSIGGRINLGFGIVIVLLLVVAGAGIFGVNNARQLFNKFDATSDATRAVLRAERDGTVKKVNAKKGDSLAVDQVILEFA